VPGEADLADLAARRHPIVVRQRMIAGLVPARRHAGAAVAGAAGQPLDEAPGRLAAEDAVAVREIAREEARIGDVVLLVVKRIVGIARGDRAVALVELPVGAAVEAAEHPLRERLAPRAGGEAPHAARPGV